jgi:hypothetical protein
MDTGKFLTNVLAEDGIYCLFASNKKKDSRVQRFYTSLQELQSTAHDLDVDGYDVYYALGTFKTSDSRKVTNVKNFKSFFLDLDCGPSKDFMTRKEASSELRAFCKKLSLPKPTLINSGRGIHVYWGLTESVPFADWLPVAERLKQLCLDNKFLADPSVTADGARVLRVPNTHNHKSDPPSPVECLMESPAVDFDDFNNLLGGPTIPVPKKYPDKWDAVTSVMAGNRTASFKDILTKSMESRGCEQIRRSIKEPNQVVEPVWRGVLSILKACSDGSRAKAHRISRGYSEYSEEETDNKWDNLTPDKRYTCAEFEKQNPNWCEGCTHKGALRTPLHLGTKVIEAQKEDNVVVMPSATFPNAPAQKYEIPEYPTPYFRGVNGGIYIRTRTKDGDLDEKLIYLNDMYVVKRIRDSEIGESVLMRLHLPRDGVREFTVPLTAVTSREEFRKQLSKEGVAELNMEDLMKYTTGWVNELQNTTKAEDAHRQFGWTDASGTSFIVGNQTIYKDRTDFNPPSTQTMGLFPAFEPKGTLEGWKETMDFYNRDGFEVHQYVVGTGFGSILMHFIDDIACSALHIHSKESGVGKTTAMAAAASVWGNPKELIIFKQDTLNTKMHRGEILHSLPLFMDELTNTRPSELSDISYQFTSGKQRGRMMSGTNQERARGDAWSLLAVTTGNTSIIERIRMTKDNPNAEAQRILETRVARMFSSTEDKSETDKFSRAIGRNYGHAGPIFLRYVMNNLDSVLELIDKVQYAVDKKAQLTSENRFWSVGATVTLVGLILARRIGLLNYDIPKVQEWIVGVLIENKLRTADMAVSIEQTLIDYVYEHYDNILRIKSTSDLRKQDGSEIDSIIIPEANARNQLVARYETDVKKLYILPKPFRIWCTKQQINYTALVSDMIEKMGAVKKTMRLDKGTKLDLGATPVIVVQFSQGIPDETSDTTDV